MPRKASYAPLEDEKRSSRTIVRDVLTQTEHELHHKNLISRRSESIKVPQKVSGDDDGCDSRTAAMSEPPVSPIRRHESGTTDSVAGSSISSLTDSNPRSVGAQRVSRNNGRLTIEYLHSPRGGLFTQQGHGGMGEPPQGEPLSAIGSPYRSRRRSSGGIDAIANAVLVAEQENNNSNRHTLVVEATAVNDKLVASSMSRRSRLKWSLFAFCITCGIILAVVLTMAGTESNPKVVYVNPDDEAAAIVASGVANTTRFWDCSGGACGCSHLAKTEDNDEPTYCRGNSMFRAPSENAYSAAFYGTAAVTRALGGDWWLGEACGKCWKLTGTSNVGMDVFPATTTIVVKATNFCSPDKCGEEPGFAIAAPGFDSDPTNRYEVCEERELGDYAGFSACENWMTGNSTDPFENCDCSLFTDPVLEEGCRNFLRLYWDDPVVEYEVLEECPEELSRLPCWKENGNDYPEGIPEFCANPFPK